MSKRFIVGLGNPGSKYEETRHNAGFLFVDYLAVNWGAELAPDKHGSVSVRLREGDQDVTLIQPQTFMNESGRCLAEWKRREGLDASSLLVVFDDMDLPPGRVRFRPSGSGGSHNGMASIIESLGTSDFARVRLGVGRPERPEDWAGYVLRRFPQEEAEALAGAMDQGKLAASLWLKGEAPDAIMTKVNGK